MGLAHRLAYRALRPWLFRLDAERAHDLVMSALSEAGPAMIRHAVRLERIDDPVTVARYDRHKYWAEHVCGWQPLPKTPVEYMKSNILWGFQQDTIGVRTRDVLGVDQLIWATDFPHQESEYPNSHESVIARNFAGVPKDEVRKMVAENTIKFFNIDGVAI